MKIDSIIANYPKLNALRQRVSDHPGIKKWLANRPETPF
jgi:predicted Abi (CAAX) family protease